MLLNAFKITKLSMLLFEVLRTIVCVLTKEISVWEKVKQINR